MLTTARRAWSRSPAWPSTPRPRPPGCACTPNWIPAPRHRRADQRCADGRLTPDPWPGV